MYRPNPHDGDPYSRRPKYDRRDETYKGPYARPAADRGPYERPRPEDRPYTRPQPPGEPYARPRTLYATRSRSRSPQRWPAPYRQRDDYRSKICRGCGSESCVRKDCRPFGHSYGYGYDDSAAIRSRYDGPPMKGALPAPPARRRLGFHPESPLAAEPSLKTEFSMNPGLPRAESEEFVPPFPPPDWVGPWPPPRREKRAPAKLPESPHHQPGIINLRPWNGGHGPHANALPPRPSNWDGHGGSRNSLPPLAPPTRSHSAFSSYNVPTQSDHYSPSIPSRHQTPDYSPYASPGMMERAGSIHSHHSSPYDPVRPIKIRAAHLLRSDRPRWNTLNSTVLVEPFATSTPLSRRNSNLSYNSHESIKQQNALDANKSLTASIPVPTLVAPVALDARVATPTPDKSSVAPEAKEKPNKKKHTSISKASKAKKAQGVVVTIPTEDIPIKSEEVDHQLLGDFEANTDVTTSIPGALEEHHVTQQALTETEASAGAAHGSLQSLTDEDVELFLMRLGVTGRARPTIGHGPAIAPLENVPHGIDGTAEREVVGTFTAIGDKSATNALALQVHHGPSSNLPVPPPPPENVASSEGQGSGSDALHVSSEVYQPSQLPTTLYDPETITYDPETGEPRFNTHLNKSTSPSSEQRRQEDDDSPRRTRKAPPAVDAAYGRRW